MSLAPTTRQPAAIMVPLQPPLVGIETLRGILNTTEEGVMALIEDGHLRWAFNLARPCAARMLVRVWTQSIAAHLNPAFDQEDDVAGVIGRILPEGSRVTGTIAARDLRSAFNVASMHVNSLIDAGSLATAPGSIRRRGRGGCSLVTRSSAFEFLKGRVIA